MYGLGTWNHGSITALFFWGGKVVVLAVSSTPEKFENEPLFVRVHMNVVPRSTSTMNTNGGTEN